ncbi:MAG: hypothetical protein HY731_15095 [Candidatus Tectomicrobia bacterium]|nr:hypothetical protein [Candidatus Tectomicrobia bacterium]
MMKRDKTSSQTFSLKPEYQEVLRNQRVDDNGPGTILHDFEIVLDFVGSQVIKVSEAYNLLPILLLPELNARLTHPIQIGIKRPQQKSYPHINGLYLLLRATGLAFVEGTGTKQTLVLDEAVLQSWRSLNATERYCTLLEAWIIRSRPEIVGEDRGWFDRPLPKCSRFFQQIPAQGLKIAGNRDWMNELTYDPGFYTLALLELYRVLPLTSPNGAIIWLFQRLSFKMGSTSLRFPWIRKSGDVLPFQRKVIWTV